MVVRSIIAATMSVHVADWLEFARSLEPGSVDLLYADPPFNTGQARTGTRRAHNGGGSALGYTDRWESVGAWVGWIGERIGATLPALKPTGSILVHVDWRTSHHARLLLDELLGPDRFINHLVWSYGLGGSSSRRFARKHDDILFYAIDPERYWFDPPRVPATSQRMRGELKKATDVIDIPSINNMARERTGYPSQKPVALLELLIGACCPPGGRVLDPCCGSGTSLVAASGLGRDGVGCDVSPDAVEIARSRLGRAPSGASGPGAGS